MLKSIASELEGIDLKDKRLNARSVQSLERFHADSQANINSACSGWAETKAAYRFFDNSSVTDEDILKPHRRATEDRMREQDVVVVAQDTTELDYTPGTLRSMPNA